MEKEIIVQNPLNGDVVLIPAKIDTVSFPPGIVTLRATLSIVEDSAVALSSIVNGYADEVDMTLFLGGETLKRVHGTHEIGESLDFQPALHSRNIIKTFVPVLNLPNEFSSPMMRICQSVQLGNISLAIPNELKDIDITSN